MSNPHEESARLKKAYALADWLEANIDDVLRAPDALRDMGRDWWAAAAKHADVKPPSETTIDLVVDRLKARARSQGDDPFDIPDAVRTPHG